MIQLAPVSSSCGVLRLLSAVDCRAGVRQAVGKLGRWQEPAQPEPLLLFPANLEVNVVRYPPQTAHSLSSRADSLTDASRQHASPWAVIEVVVAMGAWQPLGMDRGSLVASKTPQGKLALLVLIKPACSLSTAPTTAPFCDRRLISLLILPGSNLKRRQKRRGPLRAPSPVRTFHNRDSHQAGYPPKCSTRHQQLRGAAEARRAHNPEVTRSKRVAASHHTFGFLPQRLHFCPCPWQVWSSSRGPTVSGDFVRAGAEEWGRRMGETKKPRTGEPETRGVQGKVMNYPSTAN